MVQQANCRSHQLVSLTASRPEARLGVIAARFCLTGMAAAAVVISYGFARLPMGLSLWGLHVLQVLLIIGYELDVWFGGRIGRYALRDTKPQWTDVVLAGTGGLGLLLGLILNPRGNWPGFELVIVLMLLQQLWQLNVGLSRRFYRPGILLPISFMALIAIGTPLLMLPLAAAPGRTISVLDAIFTMTSAVCVTGLVVRDTATDFSVMGQTIIGLFIQLGGLGIVIFGSVLAMLFGSRLSLRENVTLSGMLNDLPLRRIKTFVCFVVVGTLLVELLGVLAMMLMWDGDLNFKQRLGHSLFHSVSAFCNAGFTLQSDSLVGDRYGAIAHLVILPLLVIGGIGFPVLDNIWRTVWHRWKQPDPFGIGVAVDFSRQRLNLHSKIVITTTAALYLYGVIGIVAAQLKPYLNEMFQQGQTANRQSLPPLDVSRIGGVLADASFMSLTARTAGFNTVLIQEVEPAGRFVLMTLMIVGGSPGGTAGGIKTTTLALLLFGIVAMVRRRRQAEVFNRRLNDRLVLRAATIGGCFIGLICVAIFLLSLSEPAPFGDLVFEAVSAASTTGLSTGITGELTDFGKVVIIATMFLGRVGPLALLSALLFGIRPSRPYVYPHEEVTMG